MGKAARTASKKRKPSASNEAVEVFPQLRVSIFTPSHNTAFLDDVYHSIKNQPFYEWIILLNNGATYQNGDPRVRIVRDDVESAYVGYLKWRCCQLATGDILLELDHDDILLPNCVAEVVKAFEDPTVGLVYSNTVRATGDFKPSERFREGNGWKYRLFKFRGQELDEYVAFDPTPSSVSRIWFAPDHVRAFRKSVYDAVGGHSRKMRVLDDQDLMCRMYLVSEFKHIDKPLYLYRITNDNTWLNRNREIQDNTLRIHDQYIEKMTAAWADRNGLRKIDLGGRLNAATGFETVDLKDADVVCDLNEAWPFEDNSVGIVRAYDVFEHLRDSVHTMKELHRVLAPGGYAIIQVPSTDGRGAFQDPTHVSFWNQNSFAYYTDERWAKYIDTPVRFQAIRSFTTDNDENGVCWAKAHLVKIVGDERVPGQLLI